MTEQIPEKWIEVITATVLKEQKKQESIASKEQHDRRFRNTELLVKNYRKLSAHCENLPEQIGIIHQEIDMGLLEHIDLNLKEVMKSKQKTKMIMDYIDAMLLAYRSLAERGGEVANRRHKILRDMYLKPDYENPTALMERYGVEKTTLYKDLKKAIEEFSVVLFGIDAYVLQTSGKRVDER